MKTRTLRDILQEKDEDGLPKIRVTPRQIKAVQALVANGGSKADAIREAKYSEAVARNPDRVFGSPGVQELLEAAGISPIPVLQQLKRKVTARKLDHMVFPTYDPDRAAYEDGLDGERAQMDDEEICEMLAELGCKVRKIVHGDQARHVYFWADNDNVQLTAIDKIINLYGLYAPKKLETKNDHRVGILSLADLRKRAIDAGEDIVTV